MIIMVNFLSCRTIYKVRQEAIMELTHIIEIALASTTIIAFVLTIAALKTGN